MKKVIAFTILLMLCCSAFGQTEAELFKKSQLKSQYFTAAELKGKFLNTDFSKLWTTTENSSVFGFIGYNYQRIRIKFITVTKDTADSNTYFIYGKSMVKNNIDEFRGTLKIISIRKFKSTSLGVDDELKNKGLKGQFVIVGDYDFSEDKQQNHSGTFKGSFQTNFYLDKRSNFHYDDIENYSDGFSNNQFVGKWISNSNQTTKRCNWGDYRIPNSGKFDIGAGEFSPAKNTNGWETVNEKYKKDQKGQKVENTKWWE